MCLTRPDGTTIGSDERRRAKARLAVVSGGTVKADDNNDHYTPSLGRVGSKAGGNG